MIATGGSHLVLALDHLLRAWIVAHRFHALDGPFWLLSLIGRGGMVWLAAGLTLAFMRRRRDLFTVSCSACCSAA